MDWLLDETILAHDFTPANHNPTFGDQRNGYYYRYTPQLIRAVNVSLATTRPLLLCGAPGCGKSSLAFNLARVLKRRYYEQVISSRSEANDLLWQFDHIRRLADANVQGRLPAPPLDKFNYIEPGVLWWAFDSASAKNRGYDQSLKNDAASDPARYIPEPAEPTAPAVILIDEIDKAEPDVPNNLLEVIGSQVFRVGETGTRVSLQKESLSHARDYPLIIITTNQERELPPAFIRRCIVYRFAPPDETLLRQVAAKNLPDCPQLDQICDRLFEHYQDGALSSPLPSTAEFLDTLIAASALLQQGWSLDNLSEVIALTVDKKTQLEFAE